MKERLSSFSIIMVFILLALIGAWLIPVLNVQLTSSRTSPYLSVDFSWYDASAKVIEQEVTSKLEGLFNAVDGVKEISSTSSKGNGNISISFKKNTDMDAVRFEVANLIRQSYPKLPIGVSYPQLSISAASEGISPILSYSINSNESPYYIKKYADNHILPQLSRIKGVSQVKVYGAAPYEWAITYDADKLFELQLTIDEISDAINTYLQKNELGKGEMISKDNWSVREISMQLNFRSQEGFNWESIPIKKIVDRLVHLGDIAKIRFVEGPIEAYYRVNGLNTINMVIYPEKEVNTIELAQTVKNVVKGLAKEISNGYQMKLTQDTTAYLVDELQKIKLRTLFSLLILLVLTIVVYRNLKYLSILFLSIIVNLLVAIIFYYILNVQLQLYSFAGITISFGIIIDNSIIMIDHLRNKGDKKAFLAILAATLTTIGAVLVIFLLEEGQRLNLWDFALVIAINIGVSLLVSLYFVPALMEKYDLTKKRKRFSRKRKRRIVRFTKNYTRIITFIKRPLPKWGLITAFVLGFGLPLHLAPKKMEGEGFWEGLYNTTLGNEWFSDEVRPTIEKLIGGSLRLFTENVFENSYYAEPERTTLRVTGSMPDGGTIEQLNEVIGKMEHYIASFDEVELFETRIMDYKNSIVSIYFKEEFEFGSFPYTLKSLLETRAISLGGLDWTVSGVGRGFSNALGTGYKSDRVVLEGYNYDDLFGFAEILQKQLEERSNGRVKDVEINSGGWGNEALYEYYLDFDPERLALAGISPSQLYGRLKNQLHSGRLRPIVNDNEWQQVKLISDRHEKFNIWDLKNSPFAINDGQYKLKELATIEKKKSGNSIQKLNQEYRLVVAYDFIGPRPLAQKFQKSCIEELSNILPIGYRVSEQNYNGWWDKSDEKQYYYIFVIVAIIFFICSILLESLRQPLGIICMIPISFIGVFLTFYLFDLNFDQGGYASFILLSGISVNSALYIVNDLNNLKKQYPGRDLRSLYFKAFHYKIIPVILTIVSTIAGLIPFIWGGQNEVFWFSFAAGSIGGLLFSLLGIMIYLPLFITKRNT
ncbi:efflux RND transporter permease subunit [Arenibacter algicola]|uniref:efflux RND transporter permease subunit n=1 Tax=Arenibacter algicola TaxID=616991 RepID=UPI001C073770|nr:efflux RND transporter permease subunit [Arenibacter algicola]MBU2903435.1 efflux RND transporter permease subunit [Arenibacter algicola]